MLQDEQELAGSCRKEERGGEEEKGEGENCEQIHTSDKNKGLFRNDVIILGWCPWILLQTTHVLRNII